jgi:hypothetical protein
LRQGDNLCRGDNLFYQTDAPFSPVHMFGETWPERGNVRFYRRRDRKE